jgi:hypothetical protein
LFNIFRQQPTVTYDIQPSADGWRVACNEVLGPPFAKRSEAIQDTLFVASQLEASGERVSVRVLELDGPHKVWRDLQLRDARLYR